MILDIHADIFSDILQKKIKGESDIIRKYHLEKFNKGGVNGGIFSFWIDPSTRYGNYKGLELIMEYAKEEIELSKDFLTIATNYSEYIESLNQGKITAMMHLEGAKVLEGNLDKLDRIYDYGVRFASLTWNEENEFANGARSKNNNGLKEKGKDFIKQANELGIIIDVSHANDRSFYDIYNTTQKPIIATHSNCRKLCNVKRNLLDEQIKLIQETGGIIGINAYRDFIHEEKKKQDVDHLINHIEHMVDLIGIDSVCFGFDYCDYIEDQLKDDEKEVNEVTRGLEDVSKTKNIIIGLRDRGYKDEDIDKISNKNFLNFIKHNVNR